MKKPLVLCILDGCGIRNESDGNAFKNANKPTFNYLWNKYPHSLLEASGNFVGLPKGQMGNSEVGHMNIGAGRVVYQPLELINKAIKDERFFKNKMILEVLEHVKKNNSKLHVMGLLSNGGVHSHINHLFALIDMLEKNNVKNVCYHLFLDGRDVNPKSSYTFIKALEDKINKNGIGKIVTISGRYYAMDRDNNYDRLIKAYDAIVYNDGPKFNTAKEAVEKSYDEGITDEFIIPSVISNGKLEDNDGVITFNFRPDRLRELFTAITNPKESPMETKQFNNLSVLTMMPVVNTVLCNHAFNHQDLSETMGLYLSQNNLNQLRIAETEKYAHVTYFYDGGKEESYPGMKKILIPSPKVATYDMKPQMSAKEVTDALIKELDKDYYDVVILNYANGDMVGHTGNYEAAKQAIEYLDVCLKRLYDKILEKEGTLIITADHGNCDIMWDKNHVPVTSHTTMPVPFIITRNDMRLKDGKLADIAPTMLELLEIKKPIEMTGESLIRK